MKIWGPFNFAFLSFLFHLTFLSAQQVRIYSGNNFSGLASTLSVGNFTTFTPTGCNGSIEVINAAVIVEMINPPSPYPFMLRYSEQNITNIEPGTSQYCGQPLRITCLNKAQSAAQLPQPTAWIPIDRDNINGDIPMDLNGAVGERVLLLRRAFLWENTEDLGCCHGPYASVGLKIYGANLLTDFGFNFDAIAQQYCGVTDDNELDEPVNSCNDLTCLAFQNTYPELVNGFKLAGPVFNADNLCNDFGQDCGSFLGLVHDPKSEWIDGPWGVCYSRMPIFRWTPGIPDQVSLVLREGDDTNCDDFLGGILIDKNDNNPILFKAWKYGWLELQVVTITQADIDYNVDVADYYWFYNWNGINPEEIHSIPQTPPFDQFVPLAGHDIPEMEAFFPAGSTVGLIGGKFPHNGTFSKPMTYKAACQPAVFGQ